MRVWREFDGLIVSAKESLSLFASTRLAGLIERLENVNKSLARIADTSTAPTRLGSVANRRSEN